MTAPQSETAGLTARELGQLATKAPEAYRDLMRQKEHDQRHRRRMAWADLITQLTGNLSGLASLGILAAVAWHAIDRGAATQGAAIICTGAVSIVAVFVTGRVTGGRISTEPATPPATASPQGEASGTEREPADPAR
ncbi:hypothetical protein ACRYCC_32945 [Actinomadura scrupuli]|uniref:hypothetical protein n=1 Tax=Actinomadura scrupuli TaxID=559629 RepID=UPI003D99D3F0